MYRVKEFLSTFFIVVIPCGTPVDTVYWGEQVRRTATCMVAWRDLSKTPGKLIIFPLCCSVDDLALPCDETGERPITTTSNTTSPTGLTHILTQSIHWFIHYPVYWRGAVLWHIEQNCKILKDQELFTILYTHEELLWYVELNCKFKTLIVTMWFNIVVHRIIWRTMGKEEI